MNLNRQCKYVENSQIVILRLKLCYYILNKIKYFNPCHAEYFEYNVYPVDLTYSISAYSIHFQSVWILIRWFRLKPADLDLQCFSINSINPGSAGQVKG